MPVCCAVGCNNRSGHQFPKDKTLRDQWVAAINRVDFTPNKATRICSEHFLPSDYEEECRETGQKLLYKRLKKNSIPTVFCWNLTAATEEKNSKRRKPSQTVQSCSVNKRKLIKSNARSDAARKKTKRTKVLKDSSQYLKVCNQNVKMYNRNCELPNFTLTVEDGDFYPEEDTKTCFKKPKTIHQACTASDSPLILGDEVISASCRQDFFPQT